MRRLPLLTLLLIVLIALAPSLAAARAGSGASFGSRGSQTYSTPYGAQPFQQSTTAPGATYAGFGRGFGGGYGGFGRHAMMGGMLGFGLGAGLFGHRFGGGFGGFGILGLLIRIAILLFIARFVFRLIFARRQRAYAEPEAAGFTPGYATPLFGAPMLGAPQRQSVALGPSDYAAFEVLLKNVQAAWSNADLNALRQFTSPEMLSYFAEQLSSLTSRGARNVVNDVRLQKGDLSEAWQEADRIYATVSMRYSMIDTTYDQSGRVLDGNPTEHVTITEFWTFLKSPGGHWILSAIQQAR